MIIRPEHLRPVNGGERSEAAEGAQPLQRRVVLLHRDGTAQIIGSFDPEKHAMHASITVPTWRGPVTAGLIQVKPRRIVYREIVVPEGLGFFDQQQQ
jgi:hypothetical protein